MKMLRKILNVILTATLILSSLLVVLGIVSKITKKDIVPVTIAWVMTESMEPTIEAQSYIVIVKVNPDKLKENDIITFVSTDKNIEGEFNTHRIKEVHDDYFITKGDNNLNADTNPVYKDQVKGKYLFSLTFITKFGRFFITKFGLFVVLSSIAIVFIIVETTGRLKAKKEERINEAIKAEVERLKQEGLKE